MLSCRTCVWKKDDIFLLFGCLLVFLIQLEDYTVQITTLQRQLTEAADVHERELNILLDRHKAAEETWAEVCQSWLLARFGPLCT
jgi:hypothetical protein